MKDFTVREVGELLVSLGFRKYKELFLEKEITGHALSSLQTIEQLVEYGIDVRAEARILLDELKKINEKATGM